jgi:hypothetical protein
MAPCKSHFDINDAQTLLALNEIANCLKCILEKRVSDYSFTLVSHGSHGSFSTEKLLFLAYL